ncbi:hypothetical protein AURDEDRAFT_153200, partial [Auricularia subglabra TFB-10046 SS5]
MAFGTYVQRGHPILFGLIIFLAIVEGSISTWLTVQYNRHPKNVFYGGTRNDSRFLVFTSWWTVLFSAVYAGLFFHSSTGSVLTSVASHLIFLSLTWIFWTAGAAAITAAIHGGNNCSTINFNLPYCNQLNAEMGFAWAVWYDLNEDILRSVCVALRALDDRLESLSAFSSASKAVRRVAISELFRTVAFRRTWTTDNVCALLAADAGRIAQSARTFVFAPYHEGRHAFYIQALHGGGIHSYVPTFLRPNWRITEGSARVFIRLLASFANLRKLVLHELHFVDTELLRRCLLDSGLQLSGLHTLSMDDSCECFLALCPNIVNLEAEFTGLVLDLSSWRIPQHIKQLKLWHKSWEYAVDNSMTLKVTSA